MPPILITVAELLADLQSRQESVFAIDGFMGAGKSTLAIKVGRQLRASVVHCDDFVSRKRAQAPYIDCLDLVALRNAVAQVQRGGVAVVLEGVCVRDIASKLSLSSATHIYVKRISPSGLWNDGYDLEDYVADNQSSTRQPELSILEYHARVQPHEQADFEVHRTETCSAA